MNNRNAVEARVISESVRREVDRIVPQITRLSHDIATIDERTTSILQRLDAEARNMRLLRRDVDGLKAMRSRLWGWVAGVAFVFTLAINFLKGLVGPQG